MSENTTLDELRQEIDDIDQQLVELLGRRFEVVRKVGVYKSEHNVQVLQEGRWDVVLKRVGSLAKTNNLSGEMVILIWNTIHEFAKKREAEIVSS